MLAIIALCAQATLATTAAPVRPLTAAQLRADWQGGLRHVQLIEVRGGDPAIALLATAFEARNPQRPGGESCIALYELPFAERAAAPAPRRPPPRIAYPYVDKDVDFPPTSIDEIEPLAALQYAGDLLPFATWWTRPTWRVVQLRDQHVAIVHDSARQIIVVQGFDAREPSLVLDESGALWDISVDGTELHMLVARSGELVLVRLDLASPANPHVVRRLCEDDGSAAASFVVGAQGVILVARATGAGLEIDEFIVSETSRTTTVVALEGRKSKGIDGIAARKVGEAVATLVGAHEWSCVALLPQLGSAARAHDICSMGRNSASRPRSQDGSGFGHALAVLPDLNGDGLPEALVTDPESILSEHVELSSGRTGACLDVLFNSGMHFGSSLSVTTDARHAVASGGRASMPERLDYPAEAVLMRIEGGATPALVPVARWVCQIDP